MAQNLRTPGPTPLPAEVKAALGRDVVNHRGPEFAEILRECVAGLQWAFDTRNDVAVLRVFGLTAPPLPLADPVANTSVAIVGYPENGPLDAVPGRIGSTTTVISDDAYGEGPVSRTVTSLSGQVRHGNSGGPAVNAAGAVETTVFAARLSGGGGYGVPASIVRRALAAARGSVSTGRCA